MKCRILLAGNNRVIINDCFGRLDVTYDCLTTSTRQDDIIHHLTYVEPHVFLYCLAGESIEDLKQITRLEPMFREKNLTFIVIGKEEDCASYRQVMPHTAAMFFPTPVNQEQLADAIGRALAGKGFDVPVSFFTDAKDSISTVSAPGAPVSPLSSSPVSGKSATADVNDILAEAMRALSTDPTGRPTNEKPVILVIDDDSNVLKLIRNSLMDKYSVATAISGRVAMKFLETKPADLILLDYEMPGENGPQVLMQLRANERTKDIPVVFLTGVTQRDKIQEVLLLKPQGYILKPIDMRRLTATVEEVLAPF